MGPDEKRVMLRQSMARNHPPLHFHCHHLLHWREPSEEDAPTGPPHCPSQLATGESFPFFFFSLSLLFLYFRFSLEITFTITAEVRHQLWAPQINLCVYETVRTSFVQHVFAQHAMMATKQFTRYVMCL